MKRPALMVGAAVLVVAVAATGAWLTRPPETAPPPRLSKAAKARIAAAQAAAAARVAVPEAATPPEPTSADFARPNTPAAAKDKDAASIDWTAMPIEELRSRANADDVVAMEELARRLVHGAGVPKDQQAGAGWLLRAAQ